MALFLFFAFGSLGAAPLGGGGLGLVARFSLGLGRARPLGRLGASAQDFGDADQRQLLAVAALALGIVPTALLEGDDLRAATVLDDLGGDRGPFDHRRADRQGGILASNHQ